MKQAGRGRKLKSGREREMEERAAGTEEEGGKCWRDEGEGEGAKESPDKSLC